VSTNLLTKSYSSALLAVTIYMGLGVATEARIDQGKQRLVTVRDSIEMVRLADPFYSMGRQSQGLVAHFSPDRSKFAIVLKRGNVAHDTNEYLLYVCATSKVFDHLNPQPILTMASSSNRGAIGNVRWLADNKTLAFVGETPVTKAQVYLFDTETKHLQRLTNHSTSIVSYDISPDGTLLVFLAEPPRRHLDSGRQTSSGVIISNQSLVDILGGDHVPFTPTVWEGEQLFVKYQRLPPKRILMEDLALDVSPLSVSPKGRYALVSVDIRNVPRLWEKYLDPSLHKVVVERRMPHVASSLTRYMVLDTKSGELSPLLDAPTYSRSEAFAWAPDGHSVLLSGTFLPLDVTDSVELELRTKTRYVVEVTLPDRRIIKITDADFRVEKWDPTSNTVILGPGPSSRIPSALAYRKGQLGWEETSTLGTEEFPAGNPLEVTLDEDINTPPKILVADAKSRRRSVFLDLNPQFAHLHFGEVRAISWKATDGHEVLGGLYFPPNYIAGKKYPLVIQTHGFVPTRFMIDGPWGGGAFSAQPLAGNGFMVLQVGGPKDVDEGEKYAETTQEAPREMAAYEGAVEYLGGLGMIDTDRVGIIGFSRTVYAVKYTLTHSKVPFTAATVADGMDAGYFSYMVLPNDDYEHLNGGSPFGKNLLLWLANTPGFSLDKVQTPIRIEAYSPYTLLGAWEWFAGLSRLRKPVEFVYLPQGTHLLRRPRELLVSQQGNVDWFCFWLKGEEDPDPAKADQYLRWRELRKLQEQNK
jgi:dipeptidyl aminopeptidase/acylaminoacyl peptidase